MQNMIFVRLRNSGQVYPYNAAGLNFKDGDYVIVEHDRGLDYGQIIHPCEKSNIEESQKEPLKKIVRLALPADLKQVEENRSKAKEAFDSCQKK